MGAFVAALVAVAGLATAGEKAADPINAKCPMSGKDVDAKATSEVKVAFCCGNCKGKFEKDPTACLGKVDKLPNEKCPVSGKAVDANATSTVAVAFCCGNCKGKFDKDPASFLGKVKGKDSK
jgi:YHS domain-containing protein